MEQALVVPFLYREFCAKTLKQGDLRCWERSAKKISSPTGKMRRTGSASSNSYPPIIQRLGSLPPT